MSFSISEERISIISETAKKVWNHNDNEIKRMGMTQDRIVELIIFYGIENNLEVHEMLHIAFQYGANVTMHQ